MKKYPFTSESVTEGHPDKVADQISDAILDAYLTGDSLSRVACETALTTGLVVVCGEVTSSASIDATQIVRDTILGIGYDNDSYGLNGNSCGVMIAMGHQSPDIAQGVSNAIETRKGSASDVRDSQGAGDQGMMFGYACSDTDDLMPLPIWTAHKMSRQLAEIRKNGTVDYLRPDGKTQVTYRYEGDIPVALDTVLISTQHDPGVDYENQLIPDLQKHVIEKIVPERFLNDDIRVLVNPTGSFVIGGPHADAGLTGRKIIVDTYGGAARHGGGAFSGKDPSKVDRSAAYAARWVAKHVVSSGAATRCELQIAYAIGVAHPVSIMVETFDTETIEGKHIAKAINEVFDLRPAAIIEDLGLRRPIYSPTSSYGHFGRDDVQLPWESLNRLDAFKSALGL